MSKAERIEVRDSTPTEQAIDKLIRAIQAPTPTNQSHYDWIMNLKQIASDVVYEEALSRIGSKSIRRS